MPSGGFLRGNLGWKIQPGILAGGVLAGRIQPGIPTNPSCGDLVVWEERFLEKRRKPATAGQSPRSEGFPWAKWHLGACPLGIQLPQHFLPLGQWREEAELQKPDSRLVNM